MSENNEVNATGSHVVARRVRLRSGHLRSEIEEQDCFKGPLCDAWQYLYVDNPAEHYHLYRILNYFKDQAETCWGGMPGVLEEIYFLLDIVDATKSMETGMNNYCEALGKIREARALLCEEQSENGSREIAIVITKLDEAELWRQRDMQMKAPLINHRSTAGGG